ncbi:thioredoxin [Candidatus Phycosocius spiralis]|uniref:Thioredoxin n=1 Tax=Candidatus Phycosocius spiralis TaxID=2815099 RepID=A0ABQ4PY66_9PROT|nr:thioredoxin [Candidatus Phycosocius spiralis]
MALIGLGTPKPSAQAASDANGLIKDSSDQSFKVDVIDASMQTPVLVDFWAPWCGPCRTLTPILEKVVRAAKGKIRLVKINIDAHPAIAGQLRVQSIPAVFAFDKGRPVDGFMGAQPESQIKALVDRLVGSQPTGLDEHLAAAKESLDLGDLGGAAQSYAQAAALDPENPKALAGLARVYVLGGDLEKAKELLATVPTDKTKDSDVMSVQAQIDLMGEVATAGELAPLAAAVAQAPDDLNARFELAKAYIAAGAYADGVEQLLFIINRERDWQENAARMQLLKVFDAAGPLSDVTRNGRRRLSSILFS